MLVGLQFEYKECFSLNISEVTIGSLCKSCLSSMLFLRDYTLNERFCEAALQCLRIPKAPLEYEHHWNMQGACLDRKGKKRSS